MTNDPSTLDNPAKEHSDDESNLPVTSPFEANHVVTFNNKLSPPNGTPLSSGFYEKVEVVQITEYGNSLELTFDDGSDWQLSIRAVAEIDGEGVSEFIDKWMDPTEKTLESLYKINKHARKYANLARKNYHAGKKYNASANSNKKQALYRVKERVLKLLYNSGFADEIEVHEIKGREYYCFYFDGWSFHSPIDDWPGDSVDATDISNGGDPRELGHFTKDANPEASNISLKAALLHIRDAFGVNANDELPERRTGGYFNGWSYL